MRAAAAGLMAVILAACSGSSTAPPTAFASIPPSPLAGRSLSTAAPTEATACHPARDPVAEPKGESITAAIALGCEAGSVAVSGGSVWVVPHLDRVALRIDPATNSVADRISLGDRGPGAEIDATDDMVWASVSSPSYDPERLVRLDPATGSVVAWIDVAAWSPVIGAGFVWGRGASGIYKIDPTTNEVAADIDVGDCGVVPFGERVICVGSGVVVSIDPATNAVTPIPGAPSLDWPVAVVDGLIWGIGGESLWAFDPNTGQVKGELPPPAGTAMWSIDAVVQERTLWMTASTQSGDPSRTGPDRLVRVDRIRMQVDCVVETPNPEYGIAAGFGSIWFPVVRQPWLLRIEPAC
jgi:hypothetical protein